MCMKDRQINDDDDDEWARTNIHALSRIRNHRASDQGLPQTAQPLGPALFSHLCEVP
jgi:hypothetical protein